MNTTNFKTFIKTDIDESYKILIADDIDKNAYRLLRLHAFIEYRFDFIIQELNRNDPKFILAFAALHPDADCSYYDADGFHFRSDKLNFIGKLDQLTNLKIVSKEVSSALKELNRLRNYSAHSFKFKISPKDIQRLCDKLAVNEKIKQLFNTKVTDQNIDKMLILCLHWIITELLMQFEIIDILKNVNSNAIADLLDSENDCSD